MAWTRQCSHPAQLHMHDLPGQLCDRRLDDRHTDTLKVHLQFSQHITFWTCTLNKSPMATCRVLHSWISMTTSNATPQTRTWPWPQHLLRARSPAIAGAGVPAAQHASEPWYTAWRAAAQRSFEPQTTQNRGAHLATHATSCGAACQRQPCIVRAAVGKFVHTNLDLIHVNLGARDKLVHHRPPAACTVLSQQHNRKQKASHRHHNTLCCQTCHDCTPGPIAGGDPSGAGPGLRCAAGQSAPRP